MVVDEHGSTLIIDSARKGDSGQYKCTVGSGSKPEPEIYHNVSVLLGKIVKV